MPVKFKKFLPEIPDEATARISGESDAQELAAQIKSEYLAALGRARHREIAAAEGFDVRAGAADLDRVVIKALPKKKPDRIIAALDWAEDDDLLASLLKVKQDFCLSGCHPRCVPESMLIDGEGGDSSGSGKPVSTVKSGDKKQPPSSGDTASETAADPPAGAAKAQTSPAGQPGQPGQDPNDPNAQPSIDPAQLEIFRQQAEFQSKLNQITIKWNLYGLIDNLLHDWFCTESMILYWKMAEDLTGVTEEQAKEGSAPSVFTARQELIPGLADLCALKPSDVDWDNSYGQDRMRYVIPAPIKEKVENALRSTENKAELINALIKQGIPETWIKAIEDGQSFVDLLREEGDNWIVVTRNRAHHGLANPTMYTIFLALEGRRMLSQGDLAASFMMKHFIFHAKAGESITQGPMAGQRNNWAKKKDIDALFTQIKMTDKAMRIASNHTVAFEYIFPPPEMFAPEKYAKHEERIYNWAGVNVVIMLGTGGTNSSGFLGVKRMVSSLVDARRRISDMFQEFFDNEIIKSATGLPEGMAVVVNFDENILKEPKQLLDEVKFMIESGIGDPQIAIAELGRNPDSVKLMKMQSLVENAKTKVFNPVYAKPVGVGGAKPAGGKDDQGRPAKPGTTKSEDTRTQSAKARS